MFACAWWYYGPGLLLVSRLVFGCALIVLFAIDLEHHLLPNAITLPGIVAGFAFSFFTEPGWLSSLIGILVGGGVLFAIAEAYYRVRHEEGLGMGDVKMLAMIGAFLGWQLTLLTLMMASFAGSIIGVLLIVTQSRRDEVRAAVRDVSGAGRGAGRHGRSRDPSLVPGTAMKRKVANVAWPLVLLVLFLGTFRRTERGAAAQAVGLDCERPRCRSRSKRARRTIRRTLRS